jgi:cytochrome P450
MVEYDPFSDEVLDDPFPVYARLRNESPVHFLERHDAWALSRFDDVWRAGADNDHLAQPGPPIERRGVLKRRIVDEAEIARTVGAGNVFSLNPPEHTLVRRAISRFFTPNAMRRLEPEVRKLVRDLLAEVLPSGGFDVMHDLAGHISVQVACRLIGLPLEDSPALSAIVHRVFSREPDIEGMPPDALAAVGELRTYLEEAIRERQRRGIERFEDVMSTYMTLELGGERLDVTTLASHLTMLVTGGTETLPKVFAGGVLQLHRHPDQRAALASDASLIPDAFTEIARYEMPTQYLTRRVRRDFDLHGHRLSEGQGVLLLYRSANRDEREFEEPDRFDVARRPRRILSFGHGTHVCLGMHAARLEGRILLEELLGAIPEYEVIEKEVVPARSDLVAGYTAMPIRFEAREARAG